LVGAREPGGGNVASAARALLASSLLLSAPALAIERFDHRGSLGLLVSGGLGGFDSVAFGGLRDLCAGLAPACNGSRYWLDLGLSYGLESGNDLVVRAQGDFAGGGVPFDFALEGGYRIYFGRERLKTFFEVDGSLHTMPVHYLDSNGNAQFSPALSLGPAFAVGVQYEVTPIFGVFGEIQAGLDIGQILRFAAHAAVGVQLRTYIFE
jgi:hypothetical protein